MANCQAVILSVEDDTGHRIIIEDLLEATRSPEVGMRQAAAIILNMYCSRSKADYTSHLRSLVSGLIRLFNDSSLVVLEESWDALNAITKVRAADPSGSPASVVQWRGCRSVPPWGLKLQLFVSPAQNEACQSWRLGPTLSPLCPMSWEEVWPHWCFPQLSQKLDAGNQLALIEEFHKEIRFLGSECKGEHVPGFCLPKRVSRAGGPGRWRQWQVSAGQPS